MQPAWRDDDHRPIAQVPGGRTEQGVLQFRPRRRQDGRRAGQVVIRPAPSQTAQPEAREGRRLDGIVGAASGELPHPAGPAHQDMQASFDIDNVHQLGGTEPIEQFGNVEAGRARMSDTTGTKRAGAHGGFEPFAFPAVSARSSAACGWPAASAQ